MVHVAAILASEVVIFIAICAQGYIIGIDGDVTGVEKAAAMATGVIVAGAMAAYEPVIVIDGYNVYVRHQFIAIVAAAVVVITAIFTDIIAITYMVLSSP
jgi:hypothetical protein